jgi:hypothetical protein
MTFRSRRDHTRSCFHVFLCNEKETVFREYWGQPAQLARDALEYAHLGIVGDAAIECDRCLETWSIDHRAPLECEYLSRAIFRTAMAMTRRPCSPRLPARMCLADAKPDLAAPASGYIASFENSWR